jgi:hypothetical protein
MCTYQEYFTICEVVKRFSGSSIWSVICPTINDSIDCKPVASRPVRPILPIPSRSSQSHPIQPVHPRSRRLPATRRSPPPPVLSLLSSSSTAGTLENSRATTRTRKTQSHNVVTFLPNEPNCCAAENAGVTQVQWAVGMFTAPLPTLIFELSSPLPV